jgi:hypothetical protein
MHDIELEIPAVEAILPKWREALGADYVPYRNHLYRMLHFFRGLNGDDAEGDARAAVAAVFHDLGIWSDHTFDYLEPSARRAVEHIGEADPGRDEIVAMIVEHHKIRPYRGNARVEAFRRADLVDVSLGLVRFGLPRAYVQEVKQAFPNAGFHQRLVQLFGQRLRTHPFSPAPMMKF